MIQEQMRACDMGPKYAGVDARYQCIQFSWSEEAEQPNCEMQQVVKQVSKKYAYLIRAADFGYPLPFLVKTRGMWAVCNPELTQADNRASKVREARTIQLHSGVAALHPDFCDRMNLRRIGCGGTFWILSTNHPRRAESLLETCFDEAGMLDCKRFLNSDCKADEVLLVIGDYSGDFAIDCLFVP